GGASMGMKDKQLAKEIAERRMSMIAPLVGVLSSPEEYYEKRREISVMYEISTRTLWRYVDAYNECGMDGLEPKGKVPGQNVIVSKELLAEAIRLRREVPSRSVPTIIQILELEGKVTPGTLKRTTLQRALAGAGYSTAMMKMYQDNGYGSQ
ncbi:MAG: helix-turn-helix domain-containing protein, partial [Oscillospiraceae bacterium]|nr:helix-turn-helix domain-containing protein [Oscillospiraceae bacterium]